MARTVEHDGFVVVLDALGMRGVWAKEDPREIVRRWTEFYDLVATHGFYDDLYEKVIPAATGKPGPGYETRYLSFADSFGVLLDTRGHSAEIFLRITNNLASIYSVAIDRGFLLRGAIAAGKFYSREQSPFYIGPAADDAGYWYDKANWAGVILTPQTGELLETVIQEDRLQRANLCRWPVPLKCEGPPKLWALDWPRPDDRRAVLVDFFARNPTDSRVIAKRDATLRFYDVRADLRMKPFREAKAKWEADHPGKKAYEGVDDRFWVVAPPPVPPPNEDESES